MCTFQTRLVLVAAVAATAFGACGARAQTPATYTLGGVSCAAAPSNFSFYCFDGTGFVGYREALATPANFGPAGTVPTQVTTVAVSAFSAGDLADIDGLVIPWWSTGDAAPHVNAVRDYFLAGGDLFILADNVGNDPVNAALGVPTKFQTDDAGATTGNPPLYAGPFGVAATVTQYFAAGNLDPAAVVLRGGRVVGTNALGQVVAAVWDRNQYAPGAGRLVIATDVDMLVDFRDAVYEPLAARNDNGRFGLNATAFLIAGGTIDALTYDIIGVPSCAISQGSGGYCGLFGVLYPLTQAAANPTNFGPAGTVNRRVAFTEFDALVPSLNARLRAVIIPWVFDNDAAPYADALRTYYLGGGNLWLLQDDVQHDPIGALLGVPTPTFTGGEPRLTNGIAPVYDGPFGPATDVQQLFAYGALDAGDVAAHGGTIVGTANGSGENVVAAWQQGQYAPGAGRMVIATDVDATFLPNNPPSNTTWALNTLAFLVTGGQFDTSAPTLTACSASPDTLWAPSGKPVPVTVSGTATDEGSGINPASLAFSVVDEYGAVQPSGAASLGSHRDVLGHGSTRRQAEWQGPRRPQVHNHGHRAGLRGPCVVVLGRRDRPARPAPVARGAFGVRHSAFGVRRSAFCVSLSPCLPSPPDSSRSPC